MQQPEYEELIDLVETLGESNLREIGLLVEQRLTTLVHQRLASDAERVAASRGLGTFERIKARREATDASHARSNREALLEHARMGREVCESRDGKVIWIPPAEIFARYGFDEFGRPKPDAVGSDTK